MTAKTLKQPVTLTHILTILAVVIIPIIGWAFSVESIKKDVIYNAADIKEIQDERKVIISLLQDILDGQHK